MPKKKSNIKDILVMDDEIFHLQFLLDYFSGKKYSVDTFSNADDAIIALSKKQYRVLILDLNVPISSSVSISSSQEKDVYKKYPGLVVASHARTKGYRDRQVIVYTVHRDNEISLEANNIRCTYIIKGRSGELKKELENVLLYEP